MPEAVPNASTGTTALPPTPTPVVAAQDADLEPDVQPLPLGAGTHPGDQADRLPDAPEHLVETQAEKVKGDEREERGEDAGGTVVAGLEDDKLWALLRRFNQQVSHTLSPPTKLPAGEPDLRRSTLPDVPFNSDIIKSNAERVYGTAGISAIYFAREMMRLMSWAPEERVRTALFCIGYFTTAWFGVVVPAVVALLIALVMVPKSRQIFFPPIAPPPGVPASATDPTNQKGDESNLAGVGHPVEHRSKSEQIEEQAWEFTNAIERFGMRVVVGGRSHSHQGNGEVGKKEGANGDDAESESDEEEWEAVRDELEGKELTDKQKKKLKGKAAREKRDAAVGKAAKAVQDALGDFADVFERIANALSPPRCYPKNHARSKIAGAVLTPILLVTAVVPVHLWAQVASFAFGIGFFAQPILIRSAKTFVQIVPDWQERLDLRNSILSKVPTNAQLILHLAREAEAEFDPLPAPPLPPTSTEVKGELAKTGIDEDAGNALAESVTDNGSQGDNAEEDEKPSVVHEVAKKGTKKLLGGLRLVAKKAATFRGDVAIANTRQKVGTKVDRLFYHSRAKDHETDDKYPAKLSGTSGHLVITHLPSHPPTLSFHPIHSPSSPTFSEPVSDLVEVKKAGVFIARAVLGWAAAISIEGMGLELRFKSHVERKADGIGKGEDPHGETHEGELWTFSHVARRDQLFLRLLSVGEQKWEAL